MATDCNADRSCQLLFRLLNLKQVDHVDNFQYVKHVLHAYDILHVQDDCHFVHNNLLHVVHVNVDNVEQDNCLVFPAYGIMHVQDKHHFLVDNAHNVVLV